MKLFIPWLYFDNNVLAEERLIMTCDKVNPIFLSDSW